MAIVPITRYPLNVAVDAAYPQGKARNVSAPSAGDGTPWEADLINDVLGMQQALLVEAGISPSGSPDQVGASDYLDALESLFASSLSVRTEFYDDPHSEISLAGGRLHVRCGTHAVFIAGSYPGWARVTWGSFPAAGLIGFAWIRNDATRDTTGCVVDAAAPDKTGMSLRARTPSGGTPPTRVTVSYLALGR